MVERAVPSIWDLAAPPALIQARSTSAAAALRRLAGEELDAMFTDDWLLATLDAGCHRGSRDDPVAALWQLATNLREHCGDSHVNAWATQGFTSLEVAVLFVAAGGTSRDALLANRGWTDAEWADTTALLEQRGLLADRITTEHGSTIRAEVERVTDELAEQPFGCLDLDDRQRLLDVLEGPARAVSRSTTIPAINPMGVQLIS